ncbi:MAG TPA: hypothetical protein VMT73_02820 [Anaerolineales bacterium]|nr:hypothetical protein [Anaerolineales bacterium]
MSDKKKRKYQTETLGLPPLKMVLVNFDEDSTEQEGKRDSTQSKKQKADAERQETIIRLIEHLTKK